MLAFLLLLATTVGTVGVAIGGVLLAVIIIFYACIRN